MMKSQKNIKEMSKIFEMRHNSTKNIDIAPIRKESMGKPSLGATSVANIPTVKNIESKIQIVGTPLEKVDNNI